jgi:hypothetical protein
MPYEPGIQDISGQLIAQGMSQAGAARARAIESLGESIVGGIKNYQQNQLFTNQALAKFGVGLQDPQFKQYVQQIVNDDPNAPQVPEALKKALKNAAAGKPDIYDSALLGSAAEGFAQNRQNQVINELRAAEAEKNRQEIARSRLESARFMLGLSEAGYTPEQLQAAMSFGAPAGAVAGPAGAMPQAPAAAPAIPRPAPVSSAGQPMAATAPAGIPNIPPELMAGVTAQAAGVKPPSAALQTMLGVGQQPQPAGTGGGLRQVTGEVFPSEIEAMAKQKARLDALAGKSSNWIANARDLMQERRRARAEENEMTPDEFMQYSKNFMKSQEGKPLGERYVVEAQPSTRPGMVAPKISLATATEAEKSALEVKTKQEIALSEAALKDNEENIAKGKAAERRLAENRVLRSALDNPAMYTGFGADAVQGAKRLFGSFMTGIKGVEDEEAFNVLAGQAILEKARNLRPASDQDVSLLIQYDRSKYKTKEGNKAIMALMDRNDERELALRDVIEHAREQTVMVDGKEQSLSEKDIRKLANAWLRANPLLLTPEETSAIQQGLTASGAKEASEPKKTGGEKPSRTVYQAAGELMSSPVNALFYQFTKKSPSDILGGNQTLAPSK